MTSSAPQPVKSPPDARTVVTASDVSFSWQPRRRHPQPVLTGFDLKVQWGEHLGLLGPNGSGKSTALSLLAGLQRPDRGQIHWHFGGAALPPTSPEVRARFAVVFQHPSLDLQLSARENLSLAAQLRGIPGKIAAPRIEQLLAAMSLTPRASDRVRDYSGGMRRRLDLARSLLSEPECLLLDEPTSGLDEHGFRRFWTDLRQMRPDATIIVATHRPDEAMLCSRLLLVHEGRIAREGTPESLIAELGEGVLVVTADDPTEVAHTLSSQLGLTCTTRPVTGGRTEIHCDIPRGELAPRLLVRAVELFPAGRLESISLRRPTLADVFAHITGSTLDAPLTLEGTA